MSLAARCLNSFPSGIRARGQGYFASNAVRLDASDDISASFLVRGSDPKPYEVEIEWEGESPDAIRTSCTCPYFDTDGLCKHIWAAILACDKLGLDDNVPGRQLLEVECDQIDSYWDEEADEDNDGPIKDGPILTRGVPSPLLPSQNRKTNPPRTPENAWRTQLKQLGESINASSTNVARTNSPVGPVEAWYVLDLEATRKWGLPIIVFHQRTTKKSGEFGKIKKVAVNREEVAAFTSPEDRQLMELLFGVDRYALDNVFAGYHGGTFVGNSYNKHSHGTLVQAMFPEILPRLCATGRFAWLSTTTQRLEVETAAQLTWDGNQAWKARIRLVKNPQEKNFQVVGEFFRDNEVLPFAEPVLILRSGLIILKDRIGLLDADDCFEWIVWLRQNPGVKIPASEETDFLKQLWALPRLPDLELPETMRWEQIRLPPAGRIRIKRAKNKSYYMEDLYANVTFQYGEQAASYSNPQSAIVDADKHQVLIRDLDAENRLVSQLRAAGLEPARDHYYHKPEGEFGLSAKKLSRAVDYLLASGWDVEAEGQLIRRPGAMQMSVTSNLDWFELSAKIDFDGVSASLPALLTALRNGEKYVQLGDGSKGMLPEQWLAKYGQLAELGESEAKDDVIRFAPSQAMLLDALLAAQEQDSVSVDQRFAAYREKLGSFSGVAAAKAPKTFKGELRHYQEEGLGWLHFLRDFGFGGCLADDMGLGKTVQVLALLDARRTRKIAEGESRAPSLVVVPRSLVFNWSEEAQRFAPDLRLLDYSSGERTGFQENIQDFDVIVTTYGILRRDIAQLKDVRFDYAILDEAQAIKNAQSQAAKACRLVQADHRLAMTGTPVENHLGELWSLFEFLNPGMLGRSSTFQSLAKSTASKMAMPAEPSQEAADADDSALAAIENEKDLPSPTAESDNRQSLLVLANALRPFILRRTKQQVLTELPERTEQTLYCEMETKQREQYEELRDYYRKSLTQRVEKQGLAKSKIHVLEALLRLRQAACHPGLLDEEKASEPSAKLDALLDQLDELMAENHKALIFSQFTSLLAIVRHHLDERKITYEYLDGKTRDRQGKVERFQTDPNCPIFLISLKAGGQGLNLTAADYVFILDPWWNPAVEAQAIDRAYRIGQTRRVFAYRLICKGTVEDKILELQKSKRELAEAIINADNSLIRSLTSEDLQLLLS